MRGRVTKAMASVALLTTLAGGMVGCEPTVESQFRSAANGAIQSGILSVLEGLVTGAFAVLEPDETDTGGDTGGDDTSGGETSGA